MEIDFNSFRYKGVKPISKKQTIKISPSLELQTEKNEYPSNFVIENLDKKMTHLSIQDSVFSVTQERTRLLACARLCEDNPTSASTHT